MEQFDRTRQADIDRLRTHATPPSADAVIDAGRPGRQGWDWAYYQPFIELALKYELPIVAVNVGRDEALRVIRDGLSAAGFDDRVPPQVLQAQTTVVQNSHCGMIDAKMAARMALAQVARDQFMARAIEAQGGGEVLLLAGNGHVRKDIGVAQWLSPATRARTQAIGVLEDGSENAQAYDSAVFTPAQPRSDPCAAADLLNDKVLPFYEANELAVLRILTDRGTEYCGKVEQHDFQLYLAINDIDHTKTKAMSPQTNGICERFHRTILQEFYQITFRKKLYTTLEELQKDLDAWLIYYNNERTHQGKMCCGRTPMDTLLDGKTIWVEKNLTQI